VLVSYSQPTMVDIIEGLGVIGVGVIDGIAVSVGELVAVLVGAIVTKAVNVGVGDMIEVDVGASSGVRVNAPASGGVLGKNVAKNTKNTTIIIAKNGRDPSGFSFPTIAPSNIGDCCS